MTKDSHNLRSDQLVEELNSSYPNSKKLALLSAALYDDAENTGEKMLGGLALMGLALLWSSGKEDIS